MVQRSYLGAGPLAAAAAALSDWPPSEALVPGDPAAFLARSMDLRGSVDLARQLAAIDRSPPPPAASNEAALRLRALVRSRFVELKAGVDRAFLDPFQRRNKLPSPAQIHAALAVARDEGKEEGIVEGKRDTLLRLLARAEITLTEDDRARIQACKDAAILDRWVDNVFGAKTAAEVLS